MSDDANTFAYDVSQGHTNGGVMRISRDRSDRMVHITARVPVALAQAFEALATAEDRSVSAELRRAMRNHVESRQFEPRVGPR